MSVVEKLICQLCNCQQFANYDNGLVCGKCKNRVRQTNGIFDFIGENINNKFNLSMWTMEFPPIVFIYEKFWRPLITIPFSDYSWVKKKILEMMELKSCSNILDIACGPGNFTRLFAGTNKNAEIIGIDLSLPMLKKAVKKNEGRIRAVFEFSLV